jgi:hypothetical protein
MYLRDVAAVVAVCCCMAAAAAAAEASGGGAAGEASVGLSPAPSCRELLLPLLLLVLAVVDLMVVLLLLLLLQDACNGCRGQCDERKCVRGAGEVTVFPKRAYQHQLCKGKPVHDECQCSTRDRSTARTCNALHELPCCSAATDTSMFSGIMQVGHCNGPLAFT